MQPLGRTVAIVAIARLLFFNGLVTKQAKIKKWWRAFVGRKPATTCTYACAG
jgi:hypothetical protein